MVVVSEVVMYSVGISKVRLSLVVVESETDIAIPVVNDLLSLALL